MRIGINLLSVVTGGAEIYAINLIRNLAFIDKKNIYRIFVVRGQKKRFAVDQDNFSFVELPRILAVPYYRIMWEQLFLPARVKKDGIDVLLSTGNADVLFSPCRTVVTFQVIQPFTVPEMYPSKIKLLYIKTMMRLSARTADAIITVSNTTRSDLIKYLKISPLRITSIYHGVDVERRNPLFPDDIRKELGINSDYILSISSVYRFKNYVNLIKGFGILREKYNQDYLLVIAGKAIEKDYYSQMLKTIDELHLNRQVILIDGVSHDKTRLLYSAAGLYVFPSYSETFGLTQIEAMACGVPVVASNTSVMPEICSDAAVYFNPSSPGDIAEKMNRVLSDRNLRDRLIRNGFERVRCFSWEKSAKQHLTVFEEIHRADKKSI